MTNDAARKLNILFLCTGNSCRSQMAEGWARKLKNDVVNAHSAGTEPRDVDPSAFEVMEEVGIDLSAQRSKHVSELKEVEFDCVVTLCGGAHESCPLFPRKTKVVHVGFDDPVKLAEEAKNEEKKIAIYRRVRDEIKTFIEQLPEALDRS